jgi:rare lipoprotein A (peptidoglycan hydrolase)
LSIFVGRKYFFQAPQIEPFKSSDPNTLTAVAIISVEVKRQIPKGASATGFAGYLRDGLDEKTTGSGIKYDKNAYIASKLPALKEALGDIHFGTYATVINLVDDKFVIVKIIDQGSRTSGDRIINLSRIAFEEIAPIYAGIVRVRVELMPEGYRP